MSYLAKLNMSSVSKTFFFFLLTSLITLSPALAGGADYIHSKVIKNSYGFGAQKYYLFEPADPKPDMAPVIVFVHGFTATMPMTYQGWINHIVKQGNIVIYPVYQAFFISSTINFPSNTVTAVQNAMDELLTGDHVRPDLDKFATVGHSMGGVLAADIAARAEEAGLPPVKAIMSVQPGNIPFPKLDDLSNLSPDTLLLCVAGNMDFIVGTKDAKKIYRSVPQIPEENKAYVVLKGASHFAPVCLSGYMANKLDHVLWQSFDELCERAFYGEN